MQRVLAGGLSCSPSGDRSRARLGDPLTLEDLEISTPEDLSQDGQPWKHNEGRPAWGYAATPAVPTPSRSGDPSTECGTGYGISQASRFGLLRPVTSTICSLPSSDVLSSGHQLSGPPYLGSGTVPSDHCPMSYTWRCHTPYIIVSLTSNAAMLLSYRLRRRFSSFCTAPYSAGMTHCTEVKSTTETGSVLGTST